MGFARAQASNVYRKYQRRIAFEDLEAVAYEALTVSAYQWDCERGEWPHFAARCVSNALTRYATKEFTGKTIWYSRLGLGPCQLNTISYHTELDARSVNTDADNGMHMRDLATLARVWIDDLPDRPRMIIERVATNGVGALTEIAKELGVSRQAMSQQYQAALGELRARARLHKEHEWQRVNGAK